MPQDVQLISLDLEQAVGSIIMVCILQLTLPDAQTIIMSPKERSKSSEINCTYNELQVFATEPYLYFAMAVLQNFVSSEMEKDAMVNSMQV